MRRLALAGFAAGLIGANGAWAQEAPPPAAPEATAPSPDDLARDAALAHDRQQAEARNQPQAQKPKITGGTVAEAGGGVAGSLLAQGVGTAVAGPVGGFAAGWIGGTVGGKAVHAVRKVLGHKDEKKDAQQDQPAPAAEPPARDAADVAPVQEPATPN